MEKITATHILEYDLECQKTALANDFYKIKVFCEKYQSLDNVEIPLLTIEQLREMADGLNYIRDFADALTSTDFYNILNKE